MRAADPTQPNRLATPAAALIHVHVVDVALLIGTAIVGTEPVPAWLGWVGIVIGVGLLVGSAEFLGRDEEDGWALAGAAIPMLYIAWSLWLLAMGVSLII